MSLLVVGMGEALWDMLPEGRKLGGAPANFAYHVSQVPLAEVRGLDYRCQSADILRHTLGAGVHEESAGGRGGRHDAQHRSVAQFAADSLGLVPYLEEPYGT